MNIYSNNELIRVEGVSKHFGVIKALKNVDCSVHSGEILGLAGHNGAGKSVLIKTIGGIYKPDSGILYFENKTMQLQNINDAQSWGYYIVPQELNLSRKLSVAENIFLGRKEFSRKVLGIVNTKYINDESKKLLMQYFGINIDPKIAAGDLDTVTQRIIQVVRCLRSGAKVIVFDETTAGLTQYERNILFKHIKTLANKGLGIIFISHLILEILNICDTVTTLRNGENVGTYSIDELDENKLIELIVGREHIKADYEKTEPSEEIIFSVKNAIADNRNLDDISFDVRKGEILGIYGIRNQGQDLLMDIIYGAYRRCRVNILLEGKQINIKTPTDSVNNSISFLPERGYKNVFIDKTIIDNIIIQVSYFKDKNIFVNKVKEKKLVNSQVNKYSIIGYSSLDKNLNSLSGGNIQKVMIARTMIMNPKILMVIEPTQGIDVGVKEEIKKLILQAAKEGRAVIIVTSEIDDIIDICNRTIVIREGKLKAIFTSDKINKSEIVKCSASG